VRQHRGGDGDRVGRHRANVAENRTGRPKPPGDES
jgi:hypothetical protein